MAPWDCLPEHIDSPEEWSGYDDDDHWYTKWRKSIKGWFAVGNAANRSKYKWANWRAMPHCIAVFSNNGVLRVENSDGSDDCYAVKDGKDIVIQANVPPGDYYLSRVQYWCDWHIALQWPLFLHGHYKDWQAYIGFKRDADRVYWLSLYVGKVWK